MELDSMLSNLQRANYEQVLRELWQKITDITETQTLKSQELPKIVLVDNERSPAYDRKKRTIQYPANLPINDQSKLLILFHELVHFYHHVENFNLPETYRGSGVPYLPFAEGHAVFVTDFFARKYDLETENSEGKLLLSKIHDPFSQNNPSIVSTFSLAYIKCPEIFQGIYEKAGMKGVNSFLRAHFSYSIMYLLDYFKDGRKLSEGDINFFLSLSK